MKNYYVEKAIIENDEEGYASDTQMIEPGNEAKLSFGIQFQESPKERKVFRFDNLERKENPIKLKKQEARFSPTSLA